MTRHRALLGILGLTSLVTLACTPTDSSQSSPAKAGQINANLERHSPNPHGWFWCTLSPEQAGRIAEEQLEAVPSSEEPVPKSVLEDANKQLTPCTSDNLAKFEEQFPQVAALAKEDPQHMSLAGGTRTEEAYRARCNQIMTGSVPVTSSTSVYCVDTQTGSTFRFRNRQY